MTVPGNEEKLTQFNEFFAIPHEFNVNATKVDSNRHHNYQQFLDNMPMPFKMAGDIITIDQSALRPLQTLGGVADQLVNYLNHQAEKIDLLVSYILSQLDEKEHRAQGTSFGGGGITFSSNSSYQLSELVELRVFLPSENCAVFCYGEIIEVNTESNQCSYKAIFHFIREEDREILVRTSLRLQSKQLQKLAQQRNKVAKEN